MNESVRKFGVFQSVRIKVGQGNKNKTSFKQLLKLPWLLDGSVRNVLPSSFYCLILIRCIVFIASAKISEREGINQSIKTNIFLWLIKNKYSNSLLQCYHESFSKCHINLQVAE